MIRTLKNTAYAATLDLAAGTADLGGHDLFSSIENLMGSTYDDRLAGNAGANRLEGKEGADVLDGRDGADRFYYHNRYDSMPTLPDRILDFSRSQGDRIDLATVDANERAPGDEARANPASRAISEPPVSQARFQFLARASDTGGAET